VRAQSFFTALRDSLDELHASGMQAAGYCFVLRKRRPRSASNAARMIPPELTA
jgi:hypothetical protein